jgi:hypothetical protein
MKASTIKAIAVSLAISSTTVLSGCASNVFPGGPTIAGGLLTNVTSPAQSLTVATDATAKPIKEGSASATSFLGLIATGNASVQAAMKDGNISKVHNVDHTINTILFGVYASTTTTVHGE